MMMMEIIRVGFTTVVRHTSLLAAQLPIQLALTVRSKTNLAMM
jgi:hypothetical protein